MVKPAKPENHDSREGSGRQALSGFPEWLPARDLPLSPVKVLTPIVILFVFGNWAFASTEEARHLVNDDEKWEELQGGKPVLLCDIKESVAGELKRALAGIIIESPVEPVWEVVCDKEAAAVYVKNLKRARIVERGREDGLEYHVVEQEVKPSLFLTTFTYCLKHVLQPYSRIDFEKVSGDLKSVHGSWKFVSFEDGAKTLLVYEMNVDPGRFIPGLVMRMSLKRGLPDALRGVRSRVAELAEQGAGGP